MLELDTSARPNDPLRGGGWSAFDLSIGAALAVGLAALVAAAWLGTTTATESGAPRLHARPAPAETRT